MKTKLLLIAVIAVLLTQMSCADKKKMVLQTHKEAVDSLSTGSNDSIVKMTNIDIHKLLDTADLSKIFYNYDSLGAFDNRVDGFFGEDHYRIQFYFSKVWKDSLNPLVYHIEGKTKFKANVAPFKGSIVLEKAMKFTDPKVNIDEFNYENDSLKGSYSLVGKLQFEEDKKLNFAGVFTGDFRMEMAYMASGDRFLWHFSPSFGSKGGGYVSAGTWQQYGKPTVKPYIFGKDIFMFANDILADFSYGERDIQINEKYVPLGWDNYWEQDEWWVDSKTKM
ncbi:hypothetical protein EGI22_00590 [Lacihabitans sp. LS3-19]|uniref:hypothetical protein n=1 Tax=Lacihabitans sp. LS3-19 TaxID=2487335 RepID=UPI0020CFB141|nr:hypothetical protein [Lacihabitans sp. LS3-19]MCP9766382.1 hypothetical protein [Lacihabitans sp. LS3-19]